MAKELTGEGIDGAQRYLLYDSEGLGTGLLHSYANLRCLLREASSLRRIAVIQNLRLLPKHNFGVPVPGDPERYCTIPLARNWSGSATIPVDQVRGVRA